MRRPENTPELKRRYSYGDRFVLTSNGDRVFYFATIAEAIDRLITERHNAPASIWSIEKILKND